MSAPVYGRLLTEVTLTCVITAEGPLLIKAGETGADPTRPDMEFVRAWRGGRQEVYLPGSSLKGAVRAQCERLVRTIGGSERRDGVWACDPLRREQSCARMREGKGSPYETSCTICRIFGSTALRGRLTFEDALISSMEEQTPRLEERTNVAIDRVMGSVLQGPFRYEVVTSGTFATHLRARNVSAAQMGLLGLALRDFNQQRAALGSGRSRGMGYVRLRVEGLTVAYPNPQTAAPDGRFRGALAICDDNQSDEVEVRGLTYEDDDLGLGRSASLGDEQGIQAFWRACVAAWRREASA